MIITTQRSPFALVIDFLITSVGWIGFFYLFTRGVISVVDISQASPQIPLAGPFVPTVQTLTVYALVAVFNATLVVLWGRYNDVLFIRSELDSEQIGVDDEVVASHFHLSSNQLHEIQGSRVTVIYHSNDGDIAHLETDQLRMQPAGNSSVFDTVRAA